MSCRGIGRRTSPLRTVDTDANGNLIEEKAKYNRAIFIIDEAYAADYGIE